MKEAHTIYHLEPKLDDSSGNGYVGVCVSRRFDKRIKQHISTNYGGVSRLYRYLRKRYDERGAIEIHERERVFKRCFTVVILHEEVCIRHDAELLEQGFILEMDTLAPNGLNLKTGHYSGTPSDETRIRMSDSHKGKPSNRKGKKNSVEHRKKISEANTGKMVGNRNYLGRKYANSVRLTLEFNL